MTLDTSSMDSDLTPIGIYNFRNQHKKFGIKVDDRRRHIYVVGKTGVGKSTLLENMIIADVRSGKGVGVVDPHGELAEKILDFVPEERLDDVIYFDPSDMDYPIAFNPMEQVGNEFRHLVASGIMGVFKKIWPDAWSARMEYILNNTLLALLELPDATLLGILRMFAEPEYRKKIVENLKDPVIKAFWQNEFARYSQKLETEALAAIQNKVGQFVSNPLIRNILGQPRSALNMRQIMDTGKIFIVNLSKGKIGEDNSALLGAMIITRLNLAAMSRVDVAERDRRDFFLYVDEFQNFATDSFASILSEARKYHLSLTIAHQYIGQLMTSDSTKVRDAVFGNVGTIVTFRVGADDAEFLEKEFMPEFLQTDLVNLAKANVYVKLMIDGVASRPFSAETVPPEAAPLNSYRDVIIKNSRERYGTPRAVVESRIAGEWLAKSGPAIDEKIGRQGERRLSEVLRPGGARPAPFSQGASQGSGGSRPASSSGNYSPGNGMGASRPPFSSGPRRDLERPQRFESNTGFVRPPMQSASPASSSPSSMMATSRPPRRLQDVERQGGPSVQSREGFVRESSTSAGTTRVQPFSRPAMPPREEPPIAPASSPRPASPFHEPSSAVIPARTSMPPVERAEPRYPQEAVDRSRPDEKPAPSLPAESKEVSELRSSLREGVAEDKNRMSSLLAAHEPSHEPAVPSIKRFPKPNVDIDALRRAISESLKKQHDTPSAPGVSASAAATSGSAPDHPMSKPPTEHLPKAESAASPEKSHEAKRESGVSSPVRPSIVPSDDASYKSERIAESKSAIAKNIPVKPAVKTDPNSGPDIVTSG